MSKERKEIVAFAILFAFLAATFLAAVTLAAICLVSARVGGALAAPIAIWVGVGASALLAGGTAAFLLFSLVRRTN